MLQKPEASGKLLKWAIELGQFKVNFLPWTTIKGQALVDFIAEFTYFNIAEVAGIANNTEAAKAAGVREKENSVPTEGDVEQWTVYVDGAYNNTGPKAGIMLISLEGHNIYCTVCFGFKASNNEAEYEALIAGLRLAHKL